MSLGDSSDGDYDEKGPPGLISPSDNEVGDDALLLNGKNQRWPAAGRCREILCWDEAWSVDDDLKIHGNLTGSSQNVPEIVCQNPPSGPLQGWRFWTSGIGT